LLIAQLVGGYDAISTGRDSRRRRGNPGGGCCGTSIRPIARGVRAAGDVAERRDHFLLADSAGVGEWRRYLAARNGLRLRSALGQRQPRPGQETVTAMIDKRATLQQLQRNRRAGVGHRVAGGQYRSRFGSLVPMTALANELKRLAQTVRGFEQVMAAAERQPETQRGLFVRLVAQQLRALGRTPSHIDVLQAIREVERC
jgi:hypothetical protein